MPTSCFHGYPAVWRGVTGIIPEHMKYLLLFSVNV
jgi:hypothetical protein